MRIDKFLKVSRIIKRRTIASEACTAGRVIINSKIAKPSTEVAINDIIEIRFGNRLSKYRVLNINENVKKEEALNLYETLAVE